MDEPTKRRPGVLIFSPLPPQRNGIADYSAKLIAALLLHYELVCVVEDGAQIDTRDYAYEIIERRQYYGRPALGRFCHLYHLGNNRDHAYMLEVLARIPGIVVLHDPNLHSLLDCSTLANGSSREYAAALEAEYGWAGTILGQQVTSTNWRGRLFHQTLPMLGTVAAYSTHMIVHSDYAARMVALHAKRVSVSVIPHFSDALPRLERSEAKKIREHFGLGPQDLIISSVGFVTPAKRIGCILKALATCSKSLPTFKFLVAGESADGLTSLKRTVIELGLYGKVLLLDYVTEDELNAVIRVSDILINLRSPTLGETSGTLARALAAGVCTIINRDGWFEEIPECTTVHVEWSPSIVSDLAKSILSLALQPRERAKIGRAAKAWAARIGSVDRIATLYRDIIDSSITAMREPRVSTLSWEFRPRQIAEGVSAGALWQRMDLLPTDIKSRPVLGVILALDERSAFASLGPSANVIDPQAVPNSWLGALQEGSRSEYALILISIALGDFSNKYSQGLRRANELLAIGGLLILELTYQSGDILPVTVRKLRQTLNASGFFMIKNAEKFSRAGPFRSNDGGAILCVAAKTSPFLVSTRLVSLFEDDRAWLNDSPSQ